MSRDSGTASNRDGGAAACGPKGDCATGENCCGSYDLQGSTLTTACHAGACPAALPLCVTGGQCQVCRTGTECAVGSCIDQECNGSEVHFCAQNGFCSAL